MTLYNIISTTCACWVVAQQPTWGVWSPSSSVFKLACWSSGPWFEFHLRVGILPIVNGVIKVKVVIECKLFVYFSSRNLWLFCSREICSLLLLLLLLTDIGSFLPWFNHPYSADLSVLFDHPPLINNQYVAYRHRLITDQCRSGLCNNNCTIVYSVITSRLIIWPSQREKGYANIAQTM